MDAYVDAMLARRAPAMAHAKPDTVRWLGWLANAMLTHHQSVFHIEWMQPGWLDSPVERWWVGAGSIVLCGLLVGAVVGLGGRLAGAFEFSVPVCLLLGLAGGVAFGMSELGERIRPVTRVGWSWAVLRQGMLVKLTRAAAIGALLGAGVSIVLGLRLGAPVGLVTVLAFCYFGGLDLDHVHDEPQGFAVPNYGMRRSMHNAWRGALTGGSLGAVLGALIGGTPGMLFCAVLFGLVVSLITGAHACLQHVILRVLLWKGGCAPWHLTRFLDFAVERIFLHRVGGGYAFVHRALLEHFAALHQTGGRRSRP